MKINILITGVPRNIYDFFLALNYLKHLDKSITIQRVLISTWEGVDKSIFKIMQDNGVELITQPLSRHAGPSNVHHQYRSFMYGLSFFKEDEYILKMRTDLNGGLSEILKMYKTDHDNINSKPVEINTFTNKYFKVFSEHIYANRASVVYPGRIQDVVFLGKKQDLVLLSHYSNYFFNINKDIIDGEYGPEFTWFGHSILIQFPAIQYLYNLVDIRKFSAKLRETLHSNQDMTEKTIPLQWIGYNLMILFNNIKVPERKISDDSSLQSCIEEQKKDLAFWEPGHKHFDFRITNQNIYKTLQYSRRDMDRYILNYMNKLSTISSEEEFLKNEEIIVNDLEMFCDSIGHTNNITIFNTNRVRFQNFSWVDLENFPILEKTIKYEDKMYLDFFFNFCVENCIVSMESAIVSFFVKNMNLMDSEDTIFRYLNLFESYELMSIKIFNKILNNLPEKEKLVLSSFDFKSKDRELRIRG